MHTHAQPHVGKVGRERVKGRNSGRKGGRETAQVTFGRFRENLQKTEREKEDKAISGWIVSLWWLSHLTYKWGWKSFWQSLELRAGRWEEGKRERIVQKFREINGTPRNKSLAIVCCSLLEILSLVKIWALLGHNLSFLPNVCGILGMWTNLHRNLAETYRYIFTSKGKQPGY